MTLLCPRCGVDLEERSAHELVIHGCTRCGGVWLDRDGVARLGAALSHKTLAAVDAVTSAASRVADEARPINCPRCAEILLRTPIAKANLMIDRCPDHGAWYDRNELQQVARALGTAPPLAEKSPPNNAPKSGPKSAPHNAPKSGPKSAPNNAPKSGPKSAPAKSAPKAPPLQVESPAQPAVGATNTLTPNRDTMGTVLDVAELIIGVALSFF